MVAEHDAAGVALQLREALQDTQAIACAKEDVDDDQVAIVLGIAQPGDRARFVVGTADDIDRCVLFERLGEVVQDDRAVFDDIGAQALHGELVRGPLKRWSILVTGGARRGR